MKFKQHLFVALTICLTQALSAQKKWTQIDTNIIIGEFNASQVALSDDGSIVAVTNESGGEDIAGLVRVYQNINGSWTQIGSDIEGEVYNDFFGRSVSLSSDGSIIAIGGPQHKTNVAYEGHVKIYQNVSGTWTQIGSDIEGAANDNSCGQSVSLSGDGNTVAIGSPAHGIGDMWWSGHVRIYRNVSGTWTQIGTDIDGEAKTDQFGKCVSLSSDGNIVAIGAAYHDGSSGPDQGRVRIFQNISDTWTQIGSNIDGEAKNDQFGHAVSISGDGSTVAIGAPLNDGNKTQAGHVQIFKNISGTWTQVGLDIDGEAEGDQIGSSISLSKDGNIVAIGAPNSGYVKIYKNTNGTWTQLGSELVGDKEFIQHGHSVALNSDGSTVAISAKYGGYAKVFNYKCPFEIASQPSDAKSINNAVFVTRHNDTAAKFQWQQKDDVEWKDLVESSQYNGVQTDSLYISNLTMSNNNELYRCIISSRCSNDTTREAKLIICNRIVSQPRDTGVFSGTVSFHVAMFDTLAEYQWQTNQGADWTDLINEGQFTGVNTQTLMVSDLASANDGQLFRCVIKGNCGQDTTIEAKINVWGVSTENLDANNIYIYPNPVSNLLNVNGINKHTEFQITDLTGKELLVGEMLNNMIDVSSLNKGIYLLNIRGVSIRFTKE